jgi:hypothetical protein
MLAAIGPRSNVVTSAALDIRKHNTEISGLTMKLEPVS